MHGLPRRTNVSLGAHNYRRQRGLSETRLLPHASPTKPGSCGAGFLIFPCPPISTQNTYILERLRRNRTPSFPMPALTQDSYEVCLDFTNDTHDCATIQLLRDYGRSTSAIVLLHPGESVTLILDAGSVYKYALKSRTKVANVRCASFPSSAVSPSS